MKSKSPVVAPRRFGVAENRGNATVNARVAAVQSPGFI